MNLLSAIFGAGVALRNRLYDRGIFESHKLTRPVISIGNISVGGTGKTPFVIALGELLKARGIAFDVLSRGYRRNSPKTEAVDPLGSPRQFGDEPLLIARRLSAPVIVGADRYRAGLVAEQKFSSRLHLLDDGFQHRRLHRDFDIVLLPKRDLGDQLLPAGRLREPISSLRRADAVVLFEADAERSGSQMPLLPQAQIFQARRVVTLDWTAGNAVAFCAIARPDQFFAGLKALGQEIAGQLTFRDHHHYSQSDVDSLVRLRLSAGADSFITTEKDVINLGPLAAQLQPLRVARLRIELESEEHVLGVILETIERRTGCRL